MRVGSIGSSYVPKINAKRGQSTPPDSSQSTPSFKADVRFLPTTRWSPDEMPPQHALSMLNALEHAKTAYKDWGSDNIIVYLKPSMDYYGGIKKKNLIPNIEIYCGYKDVEVARKEILENREKDRYNDYPHDIAELRNRDVDAMNCLKTIRETCASEYNDKITKAVKLKEKLDKVMEQTIEYAMYAVPGKTKTIEFDEGYDPKTYEPMPWWIKAMG